MNDIYMFVHGLGLIVVCLFVMAACVCRINLMEPKKNRKLWSVMYIGMAVFGMGTLIGLLADDYWPRWFEVFGLLACAINLILTQRHWQSGPPPITKNPWSR